LNYAEVDAFLRQLAQLSAPDLRALLNEVFLKAGYEGERTITYSNQAGHALSLVYLASKRGRPADGVVGELRREAALTEEDVAKLRQLLAVVQGPQTDYLASFFHFSHRPVTKWWRYRDHFQILPPPPGAPLPGQVIADWPFLIEARYSAPDQFGLKTSKQLQTINRLRLLLPVLLIGPKYKPNANRATKHWVIPSHGHTPEPPPQNTVQRLLTALRLRPQPQPAPFRIDPPIFAQEYYDVEGRNIGGPDLSPVDPTDAAPLVADHEAYYRTRGMRSDDVQEFPAVLSQLFDNYFALDEETARQFRRACYWFNLGGFFYGYSGSTSFFARVVAIESLLPKGESPHPCATCGAPHHPSITKAFRDFLEAYVPDRPAREKFYDMRSKIAHGSSLLQFDTWEEFNDFHPGRLDEDEQMDALHRVCRVALVNWLLAQIRSR
jgi:hypothetical protein